MKVVFYKAHGVRSSAPWQAATQSCPDNKCSFKKRKEPEGGVGKGTMRFEGKGGKEKGGGDWSALRRFSRVVVKLGCKVQVESASVSLALGAGSWVPSSSFSFFYFPSLSSLSPSFSCLYPFFLIGFFVFLIDSIAWLFFVDAIQSRYDTLSFCL